MSGFNQSPFGQPTIDNDPFADPFQDVSRNTNSARQSNNLIDDYNPFADQPSRPTATVRGAANPPPVSVFEGSPTSQPAILNPSSDFSPPPNYSKSGQQTSAGAGSSQVKSPEELRRWEAELARQKEELERKERELNVKSANVRVNNWPPLPDGFCFQPCFYQDIDIEIPVEFQRIVRHLYYLWIFHVGLMLLNIIGALLIFMHQSSGNIQRVFLSIFFTFLLTPFSFLCWFRPVYKAFKDDSSFNFMVFFFIFLFQIFISIMQALGTEGSCGIFVALKVFDGSATGYIVGILVLAIAIGFCAAAGMDILMISKIHNIYRSSGASMAKAQAEFTNNVLRSEHVRDATSQIVQNAVRTQFEPNQQAQAPRF